jgi:tetratricopeptide (TPR) repeat protein
LGHAPRKPASPEVVEAYLHGRFELNQPDIRDAARVYFERAIALDPAYAPAYAGLADFYRLRAVRDDEGSPQAWQQSEKYANQALSLDVDSVETHIALAYLKLGRDWDWPAVREHAQRALQLNPSSPEAHQLYARYLRIAGNLAEDLNQRKQALALDPFRADLASQLTVEYFMARDYQSAVASARRELEINPHNPYPHASLCVDLGRLKRFDEALPECRQGLAAEGHAEWAPDFIREYQKSGFEAATVLIGRKQLNETRKRAHPDLWELANAYALAGMKKETLRTLFAGLPIHEPGLLQIRVDPDFDSIRDDPQYAELVRRIGFPIE